MTAHIGNEFNEQEHWVPLLFRPNVVFRFPVLDVNVSRLTRANASREYIHFGAI